MTRYSDVKARSVGEDGRIGYTWRFFPEEARALDKIVADSGYQDRTAWFREKVLKLPPLVRESKAKKEKPAKAKKAAKKAKAAA